MKYFNLIKINNFHTFGERGKKKVSNTVFLEVLVSLNPYYLVKKKKKLFHWGTFRELCSPHWMPWYLIVLCPIHLGKHSCFLPISRWCFYTS